MRKKVFLIFLMSLNIFGAGQSYKVVTRKGVALTQQEIERNNKEIEVAAKRDYDILMKSSMEASDTLIKNLMGDLLEGAKLGTLPSEEKELLEEYYLKMQRVLSESLDKMMKKSKIKIEKIRYVTNDVAEVTMEVWIARPKIDFAYLSAGDIYKDFEHTSEKTGNMNEKDVFRKVMDKTINEMKKSIENSDSYFSVKAGIYLEKDNNRWGIGELDEKIKNSRSFFKNAE